jgi:hypothetical protein
MDRAHLRTLGLIRKQEMSAGQLLFIEYLAHTLRSSKILAFIADTPQWLTQASVLSALAENDATPEPIRGSLRQVLALIDHLRVMDQARGPLKEACAESIRQEYRRIPERWRPLAKRLAKTMAAAPAPAAPSVQAPAGTASASDRPTQESLPFRLANQAGTTHFESSAGTVWAWINGERTATPCKDLGEVQRLWEHTRLVRAGKNIMLNPLAIRAIAPMFAGRARAMFNDGHSLVLGRRDAMRLKFSLGW